MKDKKYLKLILRLAIIFVIFELITQFVLSYLNIGIWQILLHGKYNRELIAELIVLVFALIGIIIRKKWYIFKNREKGFFESVKMSGPIIIIAFYVMLLYGTQMIVDGGINFANLGSLFLFTAFVGLFEEIFFRGLIQNEIMEVYGENNKQIIISVVIASFLFGLTHLSNVFFGQALFQTIIQVFQTMGIGLIFGLVYYRTKNIWASAFVHGFYDFSLMLSDVSKFKDCAYMDNVPFNIMLTSISVSIALIIVYLIYSYRLLQKSNLISKEYKDEEEKKRDTKKENRVITGAIILAVIVFFIGTLLSSDEIDEYYVCYDYPSINIDNYQTLYYSYDNFEFNELSIDLKDGRVVIKNSITNEETTLDTEDVKSVIASRNNNYIEVFFLATDYNDYKLYYTLIDFDRVIVPEEVAKSFKSYVLPDSKGIGYLIDEYDKYPLVKSNTDEIFILKDDSIYVLK